MTVEDRDVRLELDLVPGEVVAVLGPNGAGKSTLLSVLAGLLRPDTGRLVLDGTTLVDIDRGVFVPPHRRRTVLLAQQAMLFPHLTARANVAFGPRSTGTSRRDADAAADRWLDAVDATELAGRRPAQLSGGQAQRIAVARALAAEPHLLLLDEPMSALDIAVAPALRQLLRRVLRDSARTALLVTHDILDALALADRTVVVEAGRIVEDGPTREVLARPRSAFAARLADINLVAGIAGGTGPAPDTLHGDGLTLHGRPDDDVRDGGAAVALFTPAAVAVHRDPPTGSPRNHLPVTVTEVESRGAVVRIHAEGPGGAAVFADITAAAVADLDLVPGQPAWFAVKATEVGLHARAGPGRRPGPA
ncbi:ABC transporter ATP-binding protein [Nakamurella flavida]|uniref:ABC transporter ATP-binding protein n=1 Tax=Nakamurella flavida TaxID=363630 RepID=A0A938YM37_9ACTN|nr:ABC transporter ATP-binding protein [Nakamurella flavida]MBM9477714.1 ABC transporter ATP-binding protein [Nakamurella flavida]